MESLFRKYRPQTFESMVGQRHIVSTLQNALADGRVSHAYLFTGPRGTGKTTTARLLAKALLCEAGHGVATPHPDGTCEECEEIAAGTHPDVYELDAASRTGVDNVREEIINRVAFAPSRGAYKVYVIDEVHMFSPSAFNALLKTLEEPPAHVVFILCTTDPQKIPETVLSRCQRLEFHRISDTDIEERLAYVCQQEGFEYEDEALALVARHARGGLRDALSTLETLSVHGQGRVRVQDAREVLGEVAGDSLARLAQLVAVRDVAGCFAHVAAMADRGMDVEQYVCDFTRYMRNVYVACIAGKGAFGSGEDAAGYVGMAQAMGGADRIAYLVELLAELGGKLKTSTDQRLDLEVALTRMARPAADLTLSSLASRVEDLERELAAIKAGGLTLAASPTVSPTVPVGVSAPQAARQPAGQPAAGPGQGAASQPVSAPDAVPSRTTQQPGKTANETFRPASPEPVSAPSRTASAPQRTAPAPTVQTQPKPQVQPMQPVPLPNRPAAQSASVRPQTASTPVAAPSATTPPAAVMAAPSTPGAPDPRWNQIAQLATKQSLSVGALLNNAVGWVDAEGALVVENRGSAFAAQMLVREKSMAPLKAAAAQVLGHPVAVKVVGVGAAPVPAQSGNVPAPASVPAQRPVASAQVSGLTQHPASTNPPAISAPAPLLSPESAPQPEPQRHTDDPRSQAVPQPMSQQAPQAVPAPVPAAPIVAPQPMPVHAPVPVPVPTSAPQSRATVPLATIPRHRDTAPQHAPYSASQYSAQPAPAEEAPAYEFVPDDVYDAYMDESADVPDDYVESAEATGEPSVETYVAPWEDEVEEPTPAPKPSPVSSPASMTPAASTAPEVPAASGEGDEASLSLSELLSAGFGGYVKVTREP